MSGDRDEVTPRTLVRYTIYKPNSDEVDHYGYEANQISGTAGYGTGFELDIIGFAEFEPYTSISRFTDVDEFRQEVNEKSEYVHWKDDC